MVIFGAGPGLVSRVPVPSTQCRVQTVQLRPSVDYNVVSSILTGVAVAQDVNVQFLHALGRHVYVYVFGDRIGTVGLSGLSFACPCAPGEGGSSNDQGVSKMLEWYKTYKASKSGDPVRVTIGKQNLEGFLVHMENRVVDAASRIFEWQAQLAALPEDD